MIMIIFIVLHEGVSVRTCEDWREGGQERPVRGFFSISSAWITLYPT